MTKYAVLFLGLLAGQALADCSDPKGITESDKCWEADMRSRASYESNRDEYAETVNRMHAIQVIEPDRAYLAYPSSDGKRITVYGGIGRGFDRE